MKEEKSKFSAITIEQVDEDIVSKEIQEESEDEVKKAKGRMELEIEPVDSALGKTAWVR